MLDQGRTQNFRCTEEASKVADVNVQRRFVSTQLTDTKIDEMTLRKLPRATEKNKVKCTRVDEARQKCKYTFLRIAEATTGSRGFSHSRRKKKYRRREYSLKKEKKTKGEYN